MNRKPFILFFTFFILSACKEFNDVYPPLTEAEKMMNHHPDSALLLLECMDSPDQLSPSDHALYCLLLTQAHDKNFVRPTSDSLIQIAVEYYKNTKDRTRTARALYLKGRVNDDLDRMEEAARCYLEALDMAKQTSDYLLTGLIYDQLGTAYWRLGGWEEPLAYQKQAYFYYQKAGDSLYYPYALRDLGRGYWRKKMYDSALVCYQEGLKIAGQVRHQPAEFSIWSEIGSIYIRKEMYDTAVALIRHSLALTKEPIVMPSRYVAIGNAFLRKGELDSAAYYLNKCRDSESLHLKITVYMYLSEIAARKGKFEEAYRYYHQATRWNDSIADLYKMQKVSNIQHTYRHSQLVEENQRLKWQKNRQEQFYWMALLVCLILVLFFYFHYQRYKQRKSYELSITKQKIRTNDALLRAYSIELNETKKKLNEKEKRLQEYTHQADWKLQQDVSLLIEKKNKLAVSLLEQLDIFKKMKFSGSKQTFSEADWEYLIRTINTLYDDFTHRIRKAYPQLTSETIRFCVLLKIKLSTKELTDVLCLSKDAIYKRKSRLRKDLLLPDDPRTLDEFLDEF